MIEQTGGRVAHGANQNGFVQLLREQRHGLADLNAIHFRFYGFELATDVGGCIRFGIPDIEMTRATLEKAEDDGLGRAKPLAPYRLPAAPFALREKYSGSVKPSNPVAPTRMNSRRDQPSQSFPVARGMDSIGPPSARA